MAYSLVVNGLSYAFFFMAFLISSSFWLNQLKYSKRNQNHIEFLGSKWYIPVTLDVPESKIFNSDFIDQ